MLFCFSRQFNAFCVLLCFCYLILPHSIKLLCEVLCSMRPWPFRQCGDLALLDVPQKFIRIEVFLPWEEIASFYSLTIEIFSNLTCNFCAKAQAKGYQPESSWSQSQSWCTLTGQNTCLGRTAIVWWILHDFPAYRWVFIICTLPIRYKEYQ